MNWTAFKAYVIQRLSERSTWIGMIAIVTGFGISIAPHVADSIASLGAGAGGLLLVLTSDTKK